MRNLKYNSMEKEQQSTNVDASNNNLLSAKKQKKKVSKFKNKNNTQVEQSLLNNANNINRDNNMNEDVKVC